MLERIVPPARAGLQPLSRHRRSAARLARRAAAATFRDPPVHIDLYPGSPVLTINFDETIESSLPSDELWHLITDAFENPDASPVWPVQLEAVDVDRLSEGATVTGSYQIGALGVEARYRITSVVPGRAFAYEAESTHPLDGGATVAVEPRDDGTSALRWSGNYRPRNYLTGIPAVMYVRLGFLPTFFPRLETRLRAYEARRTDLFEDPHAPPGAPGRSPKRDAV